jgi:hypothetical protein
MATVAGAFLTACGQSSLTTPTLSATPTLTATSTASPDLRESAASALTRGVSEFNGVLKSSSSKLRTALAQGDIAGVQTDAISVDRAVISFDDTIHAIKMPDAASGDAQALMTANAVVEGLLESINSAASRTEIENLYSQISMAQRGEQAKLNQLSTDLGLASSFVIVSITG